VRAADGAEDEDQTGSGELRDPTSVSLWHAGTSGQSQHPSLGTADIERTGPLSAALICARRP
jgi:hypothetical protein